MKKRILVAAVSLSLSVAALTSCGTSGEQNKTETTTQTVTTAAPTETTTAESKTTAETTTIAEDTETAEGTITGTTYSNTDLGISVTMPEAWSVLNHEESLTVMNTTMGMIYENVEAMKVSMKLSGIDYPFYAHAPLAADGTMANVIAQSMPMKSLGSSTMEDITNSLMEQVIKQYKDLNGDCTVEPAIKAEIAGGDVYAANSTVILNGEFAGQTFENYKLYQQVICLESKGKFITLNLTYFSEEDKEVMDSVLNSLTILK